MLRKQIIISFVIFAVLCATATLSLAQRTVNLNLNQEDVRITGETPGDSSGYALAYGDVDKDGFEDIIIGAPYAFDRTGKVYIIYGDANFSVPLSPQHLLLPGPFLPIPHHRTTILGGHANDLFGWSVATGDINGDDTTDVIIGAPFALSTDSTCQYNFPEGGLTYVVYGGRLLKNVSLSRVTTLHTLAVDATEIHGGARVIRSGWSVASGDINDDKFDDVIIGAPFADEAILDSIPGIRTDAGVTYIVYGDTSLPVIPTNRFYLHNPPSPITEIIGEMPGDNSGWSVSSGDINDDPSDEVIIGAPHAGNTFKNVGKTYVVSGISGSFLTTPFRRAFDLISPPALIVHVFGGNQDDNSGWSVSCGNIDQNIGKDDLIIGAPFADAMGLIDAGDTYVFFDAVLFPGNHLTVINANFTVHGISEEDRSGWSVSSGDIENDGLDDILIGAPRADSSNAGYLHRGEAYAVFGQSTLDYLSGGIFDISARRSNIIVYGDRPGDFTGFSVAAGNLNGTGGEDFSLGGPGADKILPLLARDTGQTYVVYGCDSILVNAGKDTAICYGDSLILLGTATGGSPPYKWSWFPPNGLSDPNSQTTTAKPNATTTYILTVTDSRGCTGKDEVKITVHPRLVVEVEPDTMICHPNNGGFAKLRSKVTGGTPPYSYNWFPPTGLNDATSPIPIATPTITTTYILVVTDSDSCKGSDSLTVKVFPELFAEAGPDTVICHPNNGGVAVLKGSASGGTPPYAYSWIPAADLDDPTSPTPTATPSITTTYKLTVKGSRGCKDTDSMTVIVNPELIADAGPDKAICPGGSVVLAGSASGGTPPYKYNWAPTTDLDDPTSPTPTATPTMTTTYTLTVTDSVGCVDSDSVVVTVRSALIVDAGPDTMICHPNNGGFAKLHGSVSSGSPPYSYSWTPTACLDDPLSQTLTATPTVTTTYTVTVTDSDSCIGTDSVTVTVNRELFADAGPDKAMCHPNNSGSVIFEGSASGGIPPYSYSWSPATGLDNPNIDKPTAKPTTTTAYVLTVKDSRSCTDKDTVVVMVHPELIVNAGNDTTICYCDTVILNGSVSGGTPPLTHFWKPAATIDDPKSLTPRAKPTVTTTYTLTVVDSFGCNDIDSVTVTVRIDTVAPLCRFVIDDDNNIIVNLYDGETGLAEITFLELKNGYMPDLRDFEPGDHYVEFTIVPIDPSKPAIVTIQVTDFCGNTTICDPVILTVKVVGPLLYEFDVSSIDRHLYVNNAGLNKIMMRIKNRSFEFITDPVRRDFRGNRQYMPRFGDVCIDIGSYLTEEWNHVIIEVLGPADASANLFFADRKLSIASSSLPQQFALYQNYPNPFNPTTTIEYTVPESFKDGAKVELAIYNIFGQRVKKLEQDFKQPGLYSVIWDGTDEVNNLVTSGIYFYRIKVGEYIAMKRMTFMK